MSNSTLSHPPSPPSRGFFGHYREIIANPLDFFSNAVREYGDVVYMHVGKIQIYLLNHPDTIERLLVTDNKNFLKPQLLHRAEETLGKGLLTSEGEFWLRQRRLAAPAFHKRRIEEYGNVMVEKTHEMLKQWEGQEQFDLHQEMMRVTLEIVTTTLFGTDISEKREKEVGEILEIALDRFMDYQSIRYALFDWFPRPKKLRFKRAKARLDEIIFEIIRNRRASQLSHEDDPTLLGMYLGARDEDGNSMTDIQLRDECITIFLAGHETTANALSFAFYLLSKNPLQREKLETELESILAGRSPTVNDLSSLSYTKQIIKETLRLYPPAWRVGRENVEEYQVHNYTVPPGSQLFACQWMVHRDPRWYDNPEEFLPERWTKEFEKELPRYAYFPFGGGPRLCIGYAFAEMEAALILATIAQRVQLDYLSDSPPKLYPSITLRPLHGLPVKKLNV